MVEISQASETGISYRWKKRRIKILRVNPELFGFLLLQSAEYRVMSGLPADARCMGAHIDIQTGDILLKIESEGYEPVEQGSLVPHVDANSLLIQRLKGE